MKSFFPLLLSFLPALAIGCSAERSEEADTGGGEDAYTSASAKLLDFEFDGEVLTADVDPQETIKSPPNWDSLPNNTMSLVRDLMKLDAPVKYSDVLGHFDQSGFVTVTGDEDNVFKPR